MKKKELSGLAIIIMLFLFYIKADSNIIIENLNEKFGLERNQVNCVLQDSKGFIWFGLVNGLYKFDNAEIKRVNSNIVHIEYPDVRSITEYKKGILMLGTHDYGILLYNTVLECFDTLSFRNNNDLKSIKVNKIDIDNNGVVWIASNTGIYKIKEISNKNNCFELLHWYNNQNSALNYNEIVDIKASDKGVVWFLSMTSIGYLQEETDYILDIRTLDANKSFIFLDENRILISSYGSGLKIFNIDLCAIEEDFEFHDEEDIRVKYVYKDHNGKIWLSISNVGLFQLDSTLRLSNSTFFTNNSKQFNRILSNVVLYIGGSNDGAIFICTDAGINLIHQKDLFFQSISTKFDKKSDIGYGVRAVNSINNNNILLGTMGAGLKLLNLSNNKVTDIIIDPENKHLANNIQAIIKDKSGHYWLGTEGHGVIKLKWNGKNFIKKYNYRVYPVPFPDHSIFNDFIMCLLEDNNENIWVGTWNGLSLLKQDEREKSDQSKAEFINFLNESDKPTSISSNIIRCILQDRQGNIWVGTQNGLNKVIINGDNYVFDSGISDMDGNGLNDKSILSIYQSNNQDIWFSTNNGGLCLLDPEKMKYYEFNATNGFINQIVNSISEDENGYLWLGTGDGICRYNTQTGSYNLYNKNDGLITNFQLVNSQYCNGDKIFFGGDIGIVYFNPTKFKNSLYDIDLEFTDIKIFNNSIKVDKKSPLKKNISYTKEIKLNYDQNFITFVFSSLNFNYQKDIRYSCILEGLENSWNQLGKEQKKSYTNLRHGNYIFKVKAYDSGNQDNAEIISLNLRIKPPIWKTKMAFIIYISVIIFLIYIINLIFINQEKRKNALALENLNAKKEHEIDLMKLRFFMNISHEFRTPLTLISTPLETLINSKVEEQKTRDYYQIMLKNVQKLKRLIDQLLELRKIDAGYLKMDWKIGNIVLFIQHIFDTFISYAEKRNMTFRFNTQIERLNMYFDSDKLDKVFFNLLSNAFKFTENGGEIEVSIEIEEKQKEIDNNISNCVKIIIKDNGIGISKKAMGTIFQRFKNIDTTRPIDSASTGIGLSLAKELIELHKGSISVESEENIGSIFTVLIPVLKSVPSGDIKEDQTDSQTQISDFDDSKPENIIDLKKGKQKPLVLLVEDNDDLRSYIKSELDAYFNIIDCNDGDKGFKIATEQIPDLIVSDIMMNKMDGVSMCKLIKDDEKTNHIPVILLTAHHAGQFKLDGFQIGADDYITKPFSMEILKTRIFNLINQRSKLRIKFSLGVDNELTMDPLNSLNPKFIDKLNKIIIDNIDNPDFNSTALASEMALSRMQLYRKITALTNQTVSNYIKTIRLNHAAHLLLTTDLQITEIAYKIGYSESSSFSKSFSKFFKETPTQFQNSKRNM